MPVVDKAATLGAQKTKAITGQNQWQTANKGEVANKLEAWCNSIEQANWPRRYANLTFYRYLTGRPVAPASYNFSAVARPGSANVYSRAQWEAPRYNVTQQCSDGLAARVYKERPFVQVCPIAGDFRARVKSKKLSRWLDACFYDLDIWDTVEQCGEDCRIWGSAFVKVDTDPVIKKPRVTRLLQDEIIVDENECNAGEPRRLAIRLFANRDELIAAYGDDKECIEAIDNAPKAQQGFYFGSDIDFTNVVVLREAWSLPLGKQPGRHVLAIGDHAIEDEKYTRRDFPIAKLLFKQVSTSWFGMGMMEMVLGMQRELDRVMAAIWENVRRAAWPRIIIGAGANVNPGSLGDKSNGIVNVSGGVDNLRFVYPEAISADMFRYREDLIRNIKETFRMNDQATMGTNRRELTGVAIDKAEQVDDAAHLPQALHLEDFVVQIGSLLIQAAEECNPVVRLPGRQVQEIKWEDVKLAENSYSLRPFPVGRLSKDMAQRQRQIDTWYAQGKISKATSMRLEQVPDIDGFQDLINASRDHVESDLDKMVEDGEYQPPTGFEDLLAANETAQARYLLEKDMGTPRDRLDLIMKYQAAIEQLIDEAAPPPPPAPSALPGMQGTMPAGAPAPIPSGIGGVPVPTGNTVPGPTGLPA